VIHQQLQMVPACMPFKTSRRVYPTMVWTCSLSLWRSW